MAQYVMNCGCVVVINNETADAATKPIVIYCQKHAGRDAGKMAQELIDIVEGVDTLVGKVKEDINLVLEQGGKLSELLRNLKGGQL